MSAGITQWLSRALLGRAKRKWMRTVFGEAAFPDRYYGDFEHFAPSRGIMSTTTYAGWDVTVLTAGTIAIAEAGMGGWLQLIGGGAATQGIQMQHDGEAFLPAANTHIWFGCRLKIVDADDMDWFIGLAARDTDVFTVDPTEIIAFRGDDGDANIDFQVADGGVGAAADTGSDTANNTVVELGFHVKGITSVIPYINDVAQTAVTANIPTGELAVTFGMRDGATEANNILAFDWYGIVASLA